MVPMAIQEGTRTWGLGKPLLKVSSFHRRDRSLAYPLPPPPPLGITFTDAAREEKRERERERERGGERGQPGFTSEVAEGGRELLEISNRRCQRG